LQDNKLVGLFSKKYNTQENNYSVVEKEVLAIIKAINHLKPLIYNAPITIMTDNKNITFDGDLSRRINRWKLILEEYDYEIMHISGRNNTEADLFSRCFNVINYKSNQQYKLPSLNIEEIKNYQKDEKKFEKNYDSVTKINEQLKYLHEMLMHPGITRFKKFLIKYTNLKFEPSAVSRLVKNCMICNKEKNETYKYGIVKYEFNVKEKNECVSIDIKGPVKMKYFKTNMNKNEFSILVMTDIYTRYTEVSILFDTTTETIIKAFTASWISKHTSPQKIITDNGRQFISTNFKKFMTKNNIKHILTAPNNPTGNSIVERANKEIGFSLRASRGESLDNLLHNIWVRINLNINLTTNYAP
ncbi:Transposon Tf2-9 polyprotein, partial [Dictyocoela muelleri]